MRKNGDLRTVLAALAGIAFITAVALYLIGGLLWWECIAAGIIIFFCGLVGFLIV